MAKSRQRIIILSRLQTQWVPSGKMLKSAVRGGPPFPELQEVLAPSSVYWTHREREGDVKRAQAFARTEGYEVIVYPKGTTRPLAKADAHIRKLHGG